MKLVIVFILALFVRLYNLPYFASYGAETAQHYFEIIKLLQGHILLNGPLTSHPWFRLGSIPYYLFFPVFFLTRFHPLTLFYVWTAVDILMLALNYYVIRKLFDERTSLLATLFLALSPLELLTNRAPGFYNFVIPLTYLLLYFVYKTLGRKATPFWTVFLVVGLMINLHASSLFLIPFVFGLGIFLKKFTKSSLILSLLAFTLPNIPFIISDFFKGFAMSRNLILWFPYKIVNFFSGKTLGFNRTLVKDETLLFVTDFFKTALFPPHYSFLFGLLIMAILCMYFFMHKKTRLITIIYAWLFLGIGALIIHKNPPPHYFVPIYILPIILVAYITNALLKQKKFKIIVYFFIIFSVVSNLLFIFSSRYLFLDKSKIPFNISYQTQEKITRLIIRDAHGQRFSLQRIGPLDYYEGESKENYEYLLWWLGNRPVKNTLLTYIIVEDINRVPINTGVKQIAQINGVIILRSILHTQYTR